MSDLTKTAMLLVDLQNDFIQPTGAYGRNGLQEPAIAVLPQRLKPVVDAVRKGGGWIISTHFTLVPGREGQPFISNHLRKLRPFLGKGDFEPGRWGHDLVDELQPVDCRIEKVAFSAFFQSRLEFVLQRCGVDCLLFAGIVTNGGVASTVRDAHVRDYSIVVLSDGCAAFDAEVHGATLTSLSGISSVMSIANWLEQQRNTASS